MTAAESRVKRNSIIQEDVSSILAHDLPWESFAGKTILISGANGFLPAYLVEVLLHLNEQDDSFQCKVIGLGRNREKMRKRFAHVCDRPDFSMLVQDVVAPIHVGGPVDFIIHAASQASPKYYGSDPVGTLAANSIGTYNLLSLASNCSTKGFLFISSGDVYGEVDESRIPTREDWYGYLDPTQVRACYGESKRMGETMCAAWFHQYGVPARIVRPTHTYGPGMALDDGRVFADFVADIVHNRDIVLKSDGTARRAFCYLADATLAFFTVLLKGRAGEAYNVGNEGCETSVAELATMLVRLFPDRNLAVRFEHGAGLPPGYMQSKINRGSLDTAKLRALGWQPSTDLQEGFRRTVLSFEERQ
jgi:nucleoside-diphosphate-sugar epimerase